MVDKRENGTMGVTQLYRYTRRLAVLVFVAGLSSTVLAGNFYAGVSLGSFDADGYCGNVSKLVVPTYRRVEAVDTQPVRIWPSGSAPEIYRYRFRADLVDRETFKTDTGYNEAGYQQALREATLIVTATVDATGFDADSVKDIAKRECTDSQQQGNFYIGYAFNDKYAVEAGVNADSEYDSHFSYQLPSVQVTANITAGTEANYLASSHDSFQPAQPDHRAQRTTVFTNSYTVVGDATASSTWLAGVYRYPLNERWKLFVRGGFNFWKGRTRFEVVSNESVVASAKNYPDAPASVYASGTDLRDYEKQFIDGDPRVTFCPSDVNCGIDYAYGSQVARTQSQLRNAVLETPDRQSDYRGVPSSKKDSGVGTLLGLGAEISVSRDIALRFEYTSYGAGAGYELKGLQLSAVVNF